MGGPSPIPKLARENLPELLFHYRARARNLFDRDEKVRERFASASSPDFDRYIDTEAILFFREFEEVAIPFPPAAEMLTVGGETDLRKFLDTGRNCFEIVTKNLPRPEGRPRLFDLGIGCARTMRHFYRIHEDWDLYGCDVDKAAIAYVQRSVPFVTAAVTNNLPPLPYRTAFFDHAYSVSVFTHLNPPSFEAWMQEIARVCKPGALFLPTFHGTTAMEKVCGDRSIRSMLGIDDQELSKGVEEFRKLGFTWMSQAVGSEDIDARQYGISFVREDRIVSMIDPLFELCRYSGGELGQWQDLAVLRRR